MTTLNTKIETLNNAIEALKNEIEQAQKKVDCFEYEVTESEFDELLDECYPEVEVCGLTFYPSDVLKSCDPIAYRCAKSDYESNYDLDGCQEYQDLLCNLESLQDDLYDLELELESLEIDLKHAINN